MTNENKPSELRILLSIRNETDKSTAKDHLKRWYPSELKLTEVPVLPEVVTLLKRGPNQFDVIIFEASGLSIAGIKAFIGLVGTTKLIISSDSAAAIDELSALPQPPECILSTDFENTFHKIFKKLATLGLVPPLPVLDVESYFAIGNAALLANTPLRFDVYVRMGKEGRFVRLFKKDFALELQDLMKYNPTQIPDFYFVKKADNDQIIKDQTAKMDALASQKEVPIADAKKEFSASVSAVRDVVSRAGFTPEAQAIAKSSVAMSIKALGSKPKLSSILTELKNKEGDYLANHSFMVGQVACALAHKLGWHSPTTFFKLSLAGFLHDISLNSESLAQIHSIEEAKKSEKFTPAELQQVKLHPMTSAEYSKQFDEIPSDVDQILAQHHERPDGTGFPRSMTGKIISPLAALFIMAHDLVHAIYEDETVNPDEYFSVHADDYQSGQFRKIILGLKASANA